MKASLTPASIAASISMGRISQKGRAALLIEGSKDSRLYAHFINRQRCYSFSVNGKANVLETLRILRGRREAGVLAIVDADNDHINQCVCTDPDVVTTETRDLEGLLLKAPSYTKILNEHQVKLPHDTNEKIAAACVSLGYLRCAAERNKWHIDFKSIPLSGCIDYRTVICNVEAVPRAVLQSPQNKGFGQTEGDIAKAIAAEKKEEHQPWVISQGHDMARVLAGVLTLYSGRNVTAELVESQLRLAYEEEIFRKTDLFLAICTWQKRNPAFIVLKLECP